MLQSKHGLLNKSVVGGSSEFIIIEERRRKDLY